MINFRTVITDRPEACNFIKNETLAQIFSREFCEFFQTTFFTNTSVRLLLVHLLGQLLFLVSNY